jgi:hypothetical protein
MGIYSVIKKAKKLGFEPQPPKPKPSSEARDRAIRQEIREAARKPKGAPSGSEANKKKSMKNPPKNHHSSKKTGWDIKAMVRDKNKSLKLLNKKQKAKR